MFICSSLSHNCIALHYNFAQLPVKLAQNAVNGMMLYGMKMILLSA